MGGALEPHGEGAQGPATGELEDGCPDGAVPAGGSGHECGDFQQAGISFERKGIGTNHVRPGRSESKIQVQGGGRRDRDRGRGVRGEQGAEEDAEPDFAEQGGEGDARVDPRAVQVVVRALRTRLR